MEKWSPQQRAFICERFFITQSYITTIREFRAKFNLNPRDPVPLRNTVKLWIQNFRETASAIKKKPPGLPRMVRTAENEKRVCDALLRSPRRSAGKHAQAMGMSRRFQQDGATCHTSKTTLDFLRKTFGNRLISRKTEFSWPPRSPDLSVCDFFLWGYLKQKVYVTKPRTLDELRTNIEEEISKITPALLNKVFENFEKRLDNCIAHNGHHLNDIIFSK